MEAPPFSSHFREFKAKSVVIKIFGTSILC